MAGVVLVLDLGSSRMRCVSVDADTLRNPVEAASVPYPVLGARGQTLARSFDVRLLRARLLGTLANAARTVGPRNVVSIAATGQRTATTFLDSNLQTLHAGPNIDTRAVFEGGAIDAEHGPLVHRTTGRLPSMLFAPAKLAWWRVNRPRTARRIAKTAGIDAWAALQLTGALAETDLGLAEAGLLDVSNVRPASALLETLGAPLTLLPDTVPLGGSVGRLTREASDATGLPRSVDVRLSGPDAQAAAVGCGVAASGCAAVSAGWSAPVQLTSPAPVFDPRMRTWTTLHALPHRWTVEANPGDTGRVVDAVRRLLGPRISPARFDELAAAAPASWATVAFFGPRALDLSNPGMTMGGLLVPAPITQEGLEAGPIARAALENAAYALRESIELAREVAGSAPAETALTGGMGESGIFPALLADVLGEPVRLHRRATAVGAAVIAAGRPDEIEARCAELAARGRGVEPSNRALEYEELYPRWLRLRSKLDDLAAEL